MHGDKTVFRTLTNESNLSTAKDQHIYEAVEYANTTAYSI